MFLDLKDGSMLAEEAAADQLCAGDWLAGSSSYQTLVDSLAHADPRLQHRDPKAVLERIPWADYGRVAVLEMASDSSFGPALQLPDAESFAAYLASLPSSSSRRVYLVEGLGPGLVGVLGAHFGMHPSIFVDQERVVVMNTAAQGESDDMQLPSAAPAHTTLKYYETLQFNRCPDNFRLVCGDTGRHIAVSRTDGRFTDVAVVRRKCTLWQKCTEGGGWDCVVLCDPPVRCVRTGLDYRDLFAVQTRPYQHGYVDIVPEWAHAAGPPRTSLLDDLVYYLETHADLVAGLSAGLNADPGVGAGAGPGDSTADLVGVFVRKIVAAHYLQLTGNVRAILSSAQRALSRKHDLSSLPMEKVEELWSDVQASERRVGEYGEDLEADMLKLGISLERTDATGQWIDSSAAFQFLLLRFRELRHRTECLNAAVTGLASITGNRQAYHEQQLALDAARRSIREAKSAKAVTLLGLIFIPLAYTSSLFSMTEPFNPGGDQFWVYFAASVPLILFVLAAYTALDGGYTDDGTSWSWAVFKRTARSWV